MSVLYAINTASTTVEAGSVIPCNVSKRKGCSVIEADNMILLRTPGYYVVTATVTFSAAEAGDVVLSLRKNGVAVPGITATETITTADTEVRTVTLQGVVKVLCYEGMPILTLVNASDGIDITVTNVSVTIYN